MKLLGLAALALLAACGEASRPNGTADAAVADDLRVIVLSDSLLHHGGTDTIDLGRIHAGEKVQQDLLLRNDFHDPLLILSVETSCGCTRVDFPRQPILPAAQAPFSFTFDSRGFTGFQLKSITLSTSLSSARFRLILTGEVI